MNKNCERIRRYIILSLEEYNIYWNFSFELIDLCFSLNVYSTRYQVLHLAINICMQLWKGIILRNILYL